MTALMEQPLLIGLFAFLAVIVLVSAWLKTGETRFALGLLGSIVVFGGLLATERIVQTDREQVRETLTTAAAAVERNDLDATLEYIHSSKSQIRNRAKSELRRYKFLDARITSIREIVIDYERNDPIAIAEFTARAQVVLRDGSMNVVRFVIVHLKKEEDAWKVWDFEHRDFRDAFTKKHNPPSNR